MDQKIEQAFGSANYVATLAAQRKILLEEFQQKLVYYTNGAAFKVDQNLINFTKNLIDLGHTDEIVFVDVNNLPIVINDVQEFLDNLVSIYFEATNEYYTKFSALKASRKIEGIVSL